MKVGFYIHHTTISAGGIYTYTIGILKLLLNSHEVEKIFIITSKNVVELLNEFRKNEKIKITIVDRNELTVMLRFSIWYGLYIITELFQFLIPFPKIFSRVKKILETINPYSKSLNDELDVFHVPIQYSPIYHTKMPVLITMHDLQEYHFPQYFSIKERFHRIINNKIAINDSDQIICSFNHVKKDILKYFKIDSQKVSVCPPPFAEDWFLNKKESDWSQIENKYNIKKNYLLYPAATWQHKNHLALIKAFKVIREENPEIELVCTGNKTNYFNTIQKRISEFRLSESVHFLGIVPEVDLISLYKNSSLVVIPTLYEAGSGPLYEAMRYQAPVICSNVTSLPDTVDNFEFLFDPGDIDLMAKKIKIALTDDNFRKRNVENSKRRMDELRQHNYSKNFIEVYRKFLKK